MQRLASKELKQAEPYLLILCNNILKRNNKSWKILHYRIKAHLTIKLVLYSIFKFKSNSQQVYKEMIFNDLNSEELKQYLEKIIYKGIRDIHYLNIKRLTEKKLEAKVNSIKVYKSDMQLAMARLEDVFIRFNRVKTFNNRFCDYIELTDQGRHLYEAYEIGYIF